MYLTLRFPATRMDLIKFLNLTDPDGEVWEEHDQVGTLVGISAFLKDG